MARASLLSSNFTGGELSPSIALGRVDIQKYSNGARRLENVVLTVQGGVKRRPGTRFIVETKDSTKVSRLIEFVYNRGQAYVLEMGEGYVRFLKDRVQITFSGSPYEVVSPYTEAQLPAVNYVQKADTGFFVHEAVFPYRLQRYSDVNWGLGVTPFINPAIEEQGHYPAVNLTFVGGAPVTPGPRTINGAGFYNSDVGRSISFSGGLAQITSVVSPTQVNVNVISTFKSVNVTASEWNLTGSPQDSIAPSSKGVVGQAISLSANYSIYQATKTIVNATSYPAWLSIEVTAHGYAPGDTVTISGTNAFGFDGTYVVDAVQDANHFSVLMNGDGFLVGINTNTGSVKKLDTSTNSEVWRGEDVGSYVEINGGLVKITSVVSSSVANAEVIRVLSSDIPAGAGAWRLLSNAWNARQGYPRAVSINKQRLLYAGSPGYPQHLWASEVQSYLNFSFGTADDEAFRFELDGPRNSPIRHLAPARQLLVMTESDEMSVKGGMEKSITPTNIQKTDESTMGASYVRPVKVGNEMLFVQAAGKKIASIGYRYDIDGFSAPDRTVFAAHITGNGVTQLAHQKDPDSVLYAVRTDGQLAACAYDIEQEVTGWTRWITQGAFESVAVVPTAVGEDVYAVVNRTVGGVTQRYIEVFDPEVFLDCAITGTSVGGQATWNGLAHLEGEVVQAWADGAYMGEFTVEGGEITLPRPAFSVQIGLAFECVVEMLQPEVGGNGTTAQGSQVHVNEVILRVLDTSAALINGQPVEFRRFGGDLLDQPPPMYSGDVRRTTLSDSIFTTQQVITQPYPLPFHLLDVIRRTTINEG